MIRTKEFWRYYNQLSELEQDLLELYKRERDKEPRELYEANVVKIKSAWREHEKILRKIESLR